MISDSLGVETLSCSLLFIKLESYSFLILVLASLFLLYPLFVDFLLKAPALGFSLPLASLSLLGTFDRFGLGCIPFTLVIDFLLIFNLFYIKHLI